MNILLFTTLVISLLLWLQQGFTMHFPSFEWMRPYANEKGMSCCGQLDCVESTVTFLGVDKGQTLVQIGEFTLFVDHGRVFPSYSGHGYWCFTPVDFYIDAEKNRRGIPPDVPTVENTRCVFYSSNG